MQDSISFPHRKALFRNEVLDRLTIYLLKVKSLWGEDGQREEATKPSERRMRVWSELEGYPEGEDQGDLDRRLDRVLDLHLDLRLDLRLDNHPDPHLDPRLDSRLDSSLDPRLVSSRKSA